MEIGSIQQIAKKMIRCPWALGPLQINYHDKEWGEPVYKDQKLFECLTLETFQAGLNWKIILQKRENFRDAFDNFELKKVAIYDEYKIKNLLENSGIIRHRLKIESAINNAKAILEIQKEFSSFQTYLWSFTQQKQIINNWKSIKNIPTKTFLSDKISHDLKKRNFKFIGSTTLYAFMQAIGMIQDHTINCFKHPHNLNNKT